MGFFTALYEFLLLFGVTTKLTYDSVRLDNVEPSSLLRVSR